MQTKTPDSTQADGPRKGASKTKDKIGQAAQQGGQHFQDAAKKIGNRAKELSSKAVHSAEETIKKVTHHTKDTGTAAEGAGSKTVGKAKDKV